MEAKEIWSEVEAGNGVLLDIRALQAYGRGHAPRAVSAPFRRHGWAEAMGRWLGQFEGDVYLFADNAVVAMAAQAALSEYGVTPKSVWDHGPAAWEQAGAPLVVIPQISVDDLKNQLGRYVVIDVREPDEWRSGTIPGAWRIPLGRLPEYLDQLDRSKSYAVVCAHGNRSQTGASYLADRGLSAGSVVGGMALWIGKGHPVDRD